MCAALRLGCVCYCGTFCVWNKDKKNGLQMTFPSIGLSMSAPCHSPLRLLGLFSSLLPSPCISSFALSLSLTLTPTLTPIHTIFPTPAQLFAKKTSAKTSFGVCFPPECVLGAVLLTGWIGKQSGVQWQPVSSNIPCPRMCR